MNHRDAKAQRGTHKGFYVSRRMRALLPLFSQTTACELSLKTTQFVEGNVANYRPEVISAETAPAGDEGWRVLSHWSMRPVQLLAMR